MKSSGRPEALDRQNLAKVTDGASDTFDIIFLIETVNHGNADSGVELLDFCKVSVAAEAITFRVVGSSPFKVGNPAHPHVKLEAILAVKYRGGFLANLTIGTEDGWLETRLSIAQRIRADTHLVIADAEEVWFNRWRSKIAFLNEQEPIYLVLDFGW